MIETFKKSTVVKLSENFKSTEFDCKSQNCCSVTKIDSELVDILQKIRDHFKSPVDITSGYRCSEHNKKVGGSKNSRHKTGEAADIVVRNVEPIQVAKYAESIGVRGIGLYDGFVHIDTRKKQSFWYSEAEEYRATFGGENLIKQWQKAAQKDGFTFMGWYTVPNPNPLVNGQFTDMVPVTDDITLYAYWVANTPTT